MRLIRKDTAGPVKSKHEKGRKEGKGFGMAASSPTTENPEGRREEVVDQP